MQDWPIEVADAGRLDEFVAYYSRSDLDDDLRFAAMELVIASFDEAGADKMRAAWPQIRELLCARTGLHAHTIYYWSCWAAEDVDDEDQQLASSRFLREIEI